MTVIIGYFDKKEKTMYMACDTLVTHSDFTKYNLKTKIQRFPTQNIMIGYAGSLAPIHAVKMNLSFEPREEGVDLFDYVCREIATNIVDTLDSVIRDGDAFGALIAIEDRLFEVDERGLVTESPRDFYATGTGEKTCYGALLALEYTNISIPERINIALKVTSETIFNVAPPFVVESFKL
jgi:ATP-dependent protease HslVU (ClpYQ) peptidase subunit